MVAEMLLIVFPGVRTDFVLLTASSATTAKAPTAILGAMGPRRADVAGIGRSTPEKEALAVIAAGSVPDKEVADASSISTTTAAPHVRPIWKKTGWHDRRRPVLPAWPDHG
jgi:DNA-binding NarL/FixJ family response regulator